MIPELIGGVEVYRDFLHQNEVRGIEDLVEDSIEFQRSPIGGLDVAALYNETSVEPVLHSDRSLIYILGDMREILGQNQLDFVMVRKIDHSQGEGWRKAPAIAGSTLLIPMGPFDNGSIQVGKRVIPVDAGNCIVIPHDIPYKIPRFRAGKMFLVSAHGLKQSAIDNVR